MGPEDLDIDLSFEFPPTLTIPSFSRSSFGKTENHHVVLAFSDVSAARSQDLFLTPRGRAGGICPCI